MENHDHDQEHQNHHILSDSMAFRIWGILIALTLITVAVAQIDLGFWNFTVAIFIASVKAALVCLFFMGLKYDHKENSVIFSTSVIFMAIFMILTFSDLLTRGDVYVKGPIVPASITGAAKSKFKNPWVATPEMLANGKEVFQSNCVTCHGPQGLGNGPASATLNPKPRNFTSADNWKQGRKPSQIFNTISHGLNAMPSFASLPADDRWSVVHYVRSLGPNQDQDETDAPADLAKIGIDPTKADGGGGGAEKSVPVDFAIEEMSQSPSK